MTNNKSSSILSISLFVQALIERMTIPGVRIGLVILIYLTLLLPWMDGAGTDFRSGPVSGVWLVLSITFYLCFIPVVLLVTLLPAAIIVAIAKKNPYPVKVYRWSLVIWFMVCLLLIPGSFSKGDVYIAPVLHFFLLVAAAIVESREASRQKKADLGIEGISS
jgi:hypothetical protein